MEIELKLSQQALHIIGQALGERPFKEVAPVVADIERQINAFNEKQAKPKDEAPA